MTTTTMALRNLDAGAVIGSELHFDPVDGPLLCDDRERCEACGQCPSCDCTPYAQAPAVTR